MGFTDRGVRMHVTDSMLVKNRQFGS